VRTLQSFHSLFFGHSFPVGIGIYHAMGESDGMLVKLRWKESGDFQKMSGAEGCLLAPTRILPIPNQRAIMHGLTRGRKMIYSSQHPQSESVGRNEAPRE
jgi:hypothetical protein